MTDATADDPLHTLHNRVLQIIQQRTGLLTHLAAPIRDDIMAALRRDYASERIYIRTRDPGARAALCRTLRQHFDGSSESREYLCRLHHISRRTFYRLINDESESKA